MPNLSVNTGVVEYTLNDTVKLRINPTDPAFAKRIFGRFSELESEDKAWREKISNTNDAEELLRVYDEGDAMFRRAIDDTLGEGVADAVLGDVSALAFADGFPVWMNIFIAILDEMDVKVKQELKASNPRMEKYLKKYHR